MSEWTTDTLHEHMCKVFELTKADIDDRFEAQEEGTRRALASAEKAVEKAERLAEIRAETQDRIANERAKVNGTYVTTMVYDAGHTVLVEKVAALERRHEADLADVRTSLDVSKGRGIGQNAVVIWLFLGLTACISIAAIILDLSVPH